MYERLLFILMLVIMHLQIIYPQNFWEETNGPNGGDITSMVFNSKGHIYAGTFFSNAGGISKSTDNGESWTLIKNTSVSSLIVNSNDHIFAGTSYGEVFRSTDNGVNWIQINNGLIVNKVSSLAINSSGFVFAGTYDAGIFRTGNNGDTWIETNIGLTDKHITSLTVNSFNGYIYAGTDSYSDSGTIFRSTNNGDSWTKIDNGLPEYTSHVTVLAINLNGDIFAASSDYGIFRSVDYGDNWVQINSKQAYALAINSNGIIFAGTCEGVFRSTDNGDNWIKKDNGLVYINCINHLTIDKNENIFAGADGGLFRSTNKGDNWTEIKNGLLNEADVECLATNVSGHIFAGTDEGIFRSTNNGKDWKEINNGLLGTWDVLALAINSIGHIFAGTGRGIFKSTNNGNNWFQVNNDLHAYALAINSIGHIFAGTGRGIFKSINNGDSWTPINNGLPEFSDFRTIIINSNGHIIVGDYNGNGIYKTTDNGNNWIEINNGLLKYISGNYARVRSLAINSFEHIFAGTDNGVFRSTDNGNIWELKNNGLVNNVVLSVVTSDNKLFIAIYNEGVFQSIDNGESWTEKNSGLFYMPHTLEINSNGYIFAGTGSAFAGHDGIVFKSIEPVEKRPTIINYPKIFLDKNYVNVGDVITITGKDFTTSSQIKLGFAGPSGVNIPSVELTSNTFGELTYLLSITNDLLSGTYYVVANDIAAGKYTQYISFEIREKEPDYQLKIVKPIANQNYKTNETIFIGWYDKLLENLLAGIGGIKREYNYKIEISSDGGSTWEYKKEIYDLAPLYEVTYFQSNIVLNQVGKYQIRITDSYDNSRSVTSEEFTVISANNTDIKVDFVWDYSFEKREGEPIGVAADGVSRIYLKITNTNTNTSVKKVTLSLDDGVNNEAKYLGKVLPASVINAYSDEANNANQISAERTTPNQDGNYWFWYVSPDEFVSNENDIQKNEKMIDIEINVELTDGSMLSTSKEISITRPPLALVHGFISGPGVWDKFKHDSPNGVIKFLEDGRFKVKMPMIVYTDKSFEDNSLLLSGWYNGSFLPYSYQDNLYYLCIKLRNLGYASNQCYYIGHSMGGSIAREIYRHQNQYFRKENYYKGIINKLITLNTPHNGSPWADFISNIIEQSAFSLEIFEYLKMGIHPWELPTPEHTDFYTTRWENGWKIEPSVVLNELRVHNGRTFVQTNIPSYLIIGDLLSGFQPDLDLPDWVWPILDKNSEIIEFISEVTVQAGKFLNPALFKLLGISDEKISKFIEFCLTHDWIQKGINIISIMCSIAENTNVILEGDGIVTVNSQSSTIPRNFDEMISIFDGWQAFHLSLKNKIEVGNHVDSLLNNLSENKFGFIPATYSNPKLTVRNNIEFNKIDFNNNIYVVSPSDSNKYNVNETIDVKYNLSDTTGFLYTMVEFQNNSYYSMRRANQYEFSLPITSSIIDLQRIEITVVFEKNDSTLISYKTINVEVKPLGELKAIDVYPKTFLLHMGEVTKPNYKFIYDNYVSEIGEMSSKLLADGFNPQIIDFNNLTKSFTAKAPGQTTAIINYQGVSRNIYFEVDSIDITTVGVFENNYDKNLPQVFELHQNFPNPFNNSTIIRYTVPQATRVQLEVYDILGKEISTLVNEVKQMGTYNQQWDTNNIASGIYFYRLRAGDYVQTKKMVLMK